MVEVENEREKEGKRERERVLSGQRCGLLTLRTLNFNREEKLKKINEPLYPTTMAQPFNGSRNYPTDISPLFISNQIIITSDHLLNQTTLVLES